MGPTLGSLRERLETLLVVDDNASVLDVVVAILKCANFRVLPALSGAEAIKLAGETDQKIHLLLSDVDMPRMSGLELGEALKISRPDMRVMLMSGGDNGLLVMNYGWAYIDKPFLPVKLVKMVTDVLHAPDRSQRGDGFDRRKDITLTTDLDGS
jgi:two-component system cell cycle sensor histidine kinase/response regulator CckA